MMPIRCRGCAKRKRRLRPKACNPVRSEKIAATARDRGPSQSAPRQAAIGRDASKDGRDLQANGLVGAGRPWTAEVDALVRTMRIAEAVRRTSVRCRRFKIAVEC